MAQNIALSPDSSHSSQVKAPKKRPQTEHEGKTTSKYDSGLSRKIKRNLMSQDRRSVVVSWALETEIILSFEVLPLWMSPARQFSK